MKASPTVGFAQIRSQANALPGAPAQINQHSWNINAFRPRPGVGHVLANWYDDHGQSTGYAAVLGSSNGLAMTHVLLNDDAANQRRLLLAMLGYLAPDVWKQAATGRINSIGAISHFKTFQEASNHLSALSTNKPLALRALADATELRQTALRLARQGDYAQAMDRAETASERVKEAFCRAQTPQPGEFRAFWCHSAFGVNGLTWDQAIARLADNGFTAILPNMLWGGVAYYQSNVLPVASDVAQRGDQIAECVVACRKHGLQIHVWKVNWNLGYAVPQSFIERMRREHRLQVSSRGEEERWLCPSHPANRQLEVASLLEVVRNYDVDGIHFDYIRYPDSDHCFCSACRERFQTMTGEEIQHWPDDVLKQGPLRQQWLDWRRGNITTVVKAVSEQARALKPNIKISAAVFRNWPTDRDSVGQDWKLWCDQGYLDFVCPMDYTASNRSFENMVAAQVEWAGKVPCYPGIGVSASSSHFGVDRLIDQIDITRRLRTGGFTIFNYGVRESRELLPLLGLGITAK